jgi:hypothetical protein
MWVHFVPISVLLTRMSIRRSVMLDQTVDSLGQPGSSVTRAISVSTIRRRAWNGSIGHSASRFPWVIASGSSGALKARTLFVQ